MSPPSSSNRAWDHAETLIIDLEQAACRFDAADDFYTHAVQSLAEFECCSAVLSVIDSGKITRLARSSDEYSDARIDDLHVDELTNAVPVSRWQSGSRSDTTGSSQILTVMKRIHTDVMLSLNIQWHGSDADSMREPAHRQVVEDVALAVVEFASTVLLRQRFMQARQVSSIRETREQTISAFNEGTTLKESLFKIASAWASHVDGDRVSILRIVQSRCVLLTTSCNESFDRRSRQATMLIEFANAVSTHNEAIEFTVGKTEQRDTPVHAALDRYVTESGCRRIRTDCVANQEHDTQPLAIMVTEWFDARPRADDPSMREFAQRAIRTALLRDATSWSSSLQRAAELSRSRKAAMIGVAIAALLLTMFLVPARFTIPAEGRVVPAVHRRLFAPADAIVTMIEVHNGQRVRSGDKLVALRSASVDLREEELRGDLATAKTRLASLGASRLAPKRATSDQATDLSAISSSEESLKTEIDGIEKQLAIIDKQKLDLQITSPLDGQIDRWDLEQSLSMRPVAQGQYLLDVYSSDGPWMVELEILDKHAMYLTSDNVDVNVDAREPHEGRIVRFRLQTRPEQVYQATVTKVAESAHVDAKGRSVIRLKCLFNPESSQKIGIGATVWAEVDCGTRSVAFVWFRGLIEWWESQSWHS